MPEISNAAAIGAVVIAGLLVYGLAWRATRGRSLVARALVRVGLPLVFAAPLLTLALMRVEAPRPFSKIDGQLSAPALEDMRPQARQERLPPEEEARAPEQFGAPQLPGAQPAPPTAPHTDINPNILPETAGPRIVLPPTAPSEPEGAPPAAANGDRAPESAGPPAAGAEPDAAPVPEAVPMAPAATAARDQSPWDVVPVFYGTDREQEENPERLAYNAERGRRLELGRALVTVPKIHEVQQIERPWALRIPYFDVTIYEEAEDPKKHFTMQEIKKLTKEEFLTLVRERLGGSQRFKDHAIVFVHGYNTSFDHAVYRTAQIAYDLKFDGAPFVYSWPSGGAVASYTYDRESAEASEPYLREFLELVVKETGAKSVSVIGHSMGNQALLDVLKDMRTAAPEGVVISQIIMAAPDVDADAFVNLAQRIEGLAQGVTLYAASNDRALIISRNFWRNPRAGDVLATGPLIMPGIDTIDVTAASTDIFALNHSGYAENNELLQDIGMLIASGLRPPDQRLPKLKRVTTDRGDYWRYTAP